MKQLSTVSVAFLGSAAAQFGLGGGGGFQTRGRGGSGFSEFSEYSEYIEDSFSGFMGKNIGAECAFGQFTDQLPSFRSCFCDYQHQDYDPLQFTTYDPDCLIRDDCTGYGNPGFELNLMGSTESQFKECTKGASWYSGVSGYGSNMRNPYMSGAPGPAGPLIPYSAFGAQRFISYGVPLGTNPSYNATKPNFVGFGLGSNAFNSQRVPKYGMGSSSFGPNSGYGSFPQTQTSFGQGNARAPVYSILPYSMSTPVTFGPQRSNAPPAQSPPPVQQQPVATDVTSSGTLDTTQPSSMTRPGNGITGTLKQQLYSTYQLPLSRASFSGRQQGFSSIFQPPFAPRNQLYNSGFYGR